MLFNASNRMFSKALPFPAKTVFISEPVVLLLQQVNNQHNNEIRDSD